MTSPPIRALVVDDEPAARQAIATMLPPDSPVVLVGEASNGAAAVEAVRRLRPDLLFLDIEMPDLDGFQVLDALGADVPPGVVFVTAHDRHAIRAFEVHALDYLLKPFGRPRFQAAVARALDRLSALDALTMRRTLSSMAESRRPGGPGELTVGASPARPRRIGVRTGSRVVLVDVESIDWIEASDDYVRLHTGKTSHLVSERMQALERLLDPASFPRIHRSVMVNAERIREMVRDPDGGGTIVISTGVRLRVARGRWETLEAALGIARG